MNCPLPQLVEKSTDRSSLCSENLYKGWSNRFHMNRILPFSLNFVEKVKMLAFQIHQDACLVFLVYSVFIAVAPLLPPPNPGDPCWLDEDTNCSEGGSFQLCYEGVWWIRQTKTGVFSRLRQFCLTSGTAVSFCHCHRTSSWSGHTYTCSGSPQDLQAQGETRIAGGERFLSAAGSQEGSVSVWIALWKLTVGSWHTQLPSLVLVPSPCVI